METMENIAIRNLKVFILIIISFNALNGQIVKQKKKIVVINVKNGNKPFMYLGLTKLKDINSGFETLENDLVKDVPIPDDILCRNNTGIFAFKVNRMGKIDALEYFGDLDTTIVQKIKLNILKTDGLFARPSHKFKEQFHWFVLPFLSNGSLMEFHTCNNATKLENEYEFEFKQYLFYQNLRSLLPKFPFITILNDKDHHIEMLKRGMIKRDIM
jgi:hypothetical protein